MSSTPAARKRAYTYDVVVVGARCAGAATAMLLAREGLRVALVDRAAPGRDTLSTHALMRAGVVQLHRWGLLDRVIAAGTPAIRRTVFRYGDRSTSITLEPSGGVDALYAPRRTVLDRILVDAAGAAGADVFFEATVTDVVRDESGRVAGVRGHRGGEIGFQIDATMTVGADGLNSRIARVVEAPTERQAAGASAFVYAYVTGMEADAYEWCYGPGVTASVIPTNDEATCVAVGVRPERFRSDVAGDLRAGFDRVLQEASPDVARRVRAARPPRRFRTFPGLPGFMRRPWGQGWALVGDAGYYKDPGTAHGMSDALRDAELVATAVSAIVRGERSGDDSLLEYHRIRDRLSGDFFSVTNRLASFDWDAETVEHHLRALSAAMSDEVEYLSGLDEPTPVHRS